MQSRGQQEYGTALFVQPKRIHMKRLFVIIFQVMLFMQLSAQRTFLHPGISFTQSDIDRMKAMVAAKVEPYYSTYLRMKSDRFTQRGATERLQIKEKNYNGTIGVDGRAALQQALVWKIEGDEVYAKKSVAILNSYLNLTNASARGTAPLDAGKIYMLIDAAELMRDYTGWAAEDQQAFKDMLVYPCYSTKIDYHALYANMDDSKNGITFYWNIYNGDDNRFGNQGIFAMRGLIAMGIFLDNDTIYQRGIRKFLSLPHLSGDLPYPSGPVTSVFKSSTDYQEEYTCTHLSVTEDYGYDDELQYYIYENGQGSELSRDQGHNLCGINNCNQIARMIWNQGGNIYDAYDGRLLKGIEYNYRYNYDTSFNPTVDNGDFISRMARCGRWKGLKPYDRDRGAHPQCLTADLMMYKIRLGKRDSDIIWLQQAYNQMLDSLGYEPGYVDSGHYYEYNGWGQLLDYRTEWMAGDAVTFANGYRQSRIPNIPCRIAAVDYDFYNDEAEGQGHTYYNIGNSHSTIYRTDGTPEITHTDDNGYVITDIQDGEWLNYTVNCSRDTTYILAVNCMAPKAGTTITATVDNGASVTKTIGKVNEFSSVQLGTLPLKAGTHVIRLSFGGQDGNLQLKELIITNNTWGLIAPVQRLMLESLGTLPANFTTFRY